MRLIPNWDVADLKDFRRKVIQNMEEWSTKLEVEVLIVDNLSVVNPDNTQAADAAELVQSFRRLRSKLGISILLVGHTPKLPVGMRIEIQNLAGSAQMANLIDSCFALNKCGQGKVYIKQLKQRNDQQQFGAENVILGTIVKDPYVKFKLLGYAHEGELLSESGDISTRNERIISDYATGSHSQRKLAEMYKLSKSQINEILKKSVRPVNESGQSGQGGQIENDQFPF
jgi:RecA-family ATPase